MEYMPKPLINFWRSVRLTSREILVPALQDRKEDISPRYLTSGGLPGQRIWEA